MMCNKNRYNNKNGVQREGLLLSLSIILIPTTSCCSLFITIELSTYTRVGTSWIIAAIITFLDFLNFDL